ncbi:chalcone isomerase [Bacterioplanes sanyensis]|uniref:chalcone isomerase family protein n=1 Tax=Bacterioplanes sanyensis TaxID=1249553 RepID=UPI0016750F27|nr:chalcone isomerase family protein [Bacterioplanes sanyensis]GGY40633.1 chalcone isomerase [Bacterioplanes sanyensis]
MLRILLALSLLLGQTFMAQAKEFSGLELADSFTLDDHALTLNGAGVRTKFFLDLYIAALYLPELEDDGDDIVEADEPMALRLHIISSMITGKRMADSTRDGFVRSTGGNLAPIEDKVEQLITAFADDINEGDVFDLVYRPSNGVTVYHNGEAKSQVAGLAFKQALFGIWLSDDPVQEDLRDALLVRAD